jgi:hypothetical protein
MRESRQVNADEIISLMQTTQSQFADQWLIAVELYELCLNFKTAVSATHQISQWLIDLQTRLPDKKHLIQEGMRLANIL